MSWLYLILAICLEILGTALLKASSELFSLKTIALLLAYGLSLVFLSLALKKIDVGVAYAIWSGLGILAIEIIGVVFFKESINVSKAAFMLMILVGTVGLNFSSR
jgi:small multidrug resistance pump